MLQSRVRLAGRHAQQPAIVKQTLKQLAHTVIQRLDQFPRLARGAEGAAIGQVDGLAQLFVSIGQQRAYSLRQAQANTAADQMAIGISYY